jgi:hypothetical protein
MNKFVKIVLISFLVFIGLGGGAFLYVYQNIDGMKKYALDELNVYLKAPLSAQDIDVTVVATFPKVSLTLSGVSMKDPLRASKYLLQAKHLHLGFNLYDVINKNYKVQLLQLDSGKLDVFINANGNYNFNLLKEESTTNPNEPKSNFYFQLEKVGLKEMELLYEDQQNATQGNVFAQEASFSGKFSDKIYDLSVSLSGLSNGIEVGYLKLFKEKMLNLTFDLLVDNSKNQYEFKRGEFAINSLMLKLQGLMRFGSKSSFYDLSFKANKITIQDLLSVMPFQLPETYKKYASQGNVYFDGSYKGNYSNKLNPDLNIRFGIENGSLTDPDTKLKVDQIQLIGLFKGGVNMSQSSIQISSLAAELPGSKIQGKITIDNLDKPELFAELNGNADLLKVQEFLKMEDVKELKGQVDFTCTLKGIKEGNNWIWNPAFTKGIVDAKIETLVLSYLTKPFKEVALNALLNGNALTLQNLQLKIGESDFAIKGELPNFMQSYANAKQTFLGDLQVTCSYLNTNDLLIYDDSDPKEGEDDALLYQIKLKVNANKFVFNKLEATQLSSRTILFPNKTEIPYFSLQTCGGSFAGEASWQLNNNGYTLKANHQATHIDLPLLLKSFDNFGQNEITDKHLKGFLTARTDMIIPYDKKMKVQEEKLLVVTDMEIKQGELNNYEPLMGLSKFADVNDLKNLRFSELKNTLSIKNRTITIPEMAIKNNALNLSISGKHSFDNFVNYSVKLALSELLQKKRKVQPNEFGEEDAKTKSWTVYINIEGPMDNLKYSFDRKGVKQQLQQEVTAEKQAIKEVLKEEFKIKKDTSIKKVEKKNNNNDELEFEEN